MNLYVAVNILEINLTKGDKMFSEFGGFKLLDLCYWNNICRIVSRSQYNIYIEVQCNSWCERWVSGSFRDIRR